jgi:hypothetical protein
MNADPMALDCNKFHQIHVIVFHIYEKLHSHKSYFTRSTWGSLRGDVVLW